MKTLISDVHTHSEPLVAGTAVVSLSVTKGWMPHEGQLYAAGLHPWDVDEHWAERVEELRELYRSPSSGQLVMIGEMGLDKLRGGDYGLQRRALTEQLEIAESIGRIPVIHDVRSMNELLSLRRELRCQLPWLIHGFRGGAEQARQYLRAGCHLSLGQHFREDALRALPVEEIFLESDDLPDSLAVAYALAASVTGLSAETLRQHVNDNVLNLLRQ